ncbi:DUF4176 domain-containing protein [Bacillus sp. JJ634]
MTEQKYLPNGSIVLVKGGTKKLMIYGRKQLLLKENEQMYDYLAVPYPEGYINPDYSYVFNHSDIEEIIFYGFTDKEENEFQHVLQQA